MTVLFIIITLLWLGEFVFFPSLEKEERSQQKTFRAILATILFIIIINAIMYWTSFLLIESPYLQGVALVIYSIGIILRYWSSILLGKNFSRDVEVSKNQELISHGPYRYVRHPLYTGLFLLTIAVPLFIGNITVFLIAIALMYNVLNRRIVEEEKFMEEVLGARYVRWKNERYKFVPFIDQKIQVK